MKNNDFGRGKKKNSRINTILIIIAILFFIAGIVILLIDPIRSARRQKITDEALESIESQISEMSSENTDATAMTIVVPKYGNEVAGEKYDFYGNEDEILDLQQEVADMEADLPDDVTLTCIGILKIDKIDLNLPVWNQTNRVALRYGLGWYEHSATPGSYGNATILGHRNQHTNTMFYRLKEVTEGDTVRFITYYGRELDFTVREIRIVSPNHVMENIVADASSEQQLTLVTCATEYGKGYRKLVICSLNKR